MFIEKYPKFERDTILKAEMLENLKDFPRDIVDLLYHSYSDGIIVGGEIEIKEGRTIMVQPGILKFRKHIYYQKNTAEIICEPNGMEQILVVCFNNREEHISDVVYATEYVLKQDGEVAENEMELCRFILKAGAVLRKNYQNLQDMATVHNTINIVNVQFAARKEASLSPEITTRFAEEMLKCRLTDAMDLSFVMQCAQGNVMPKMLIEQYVKYRMPNAERGNLSHKQLTYLH